MTRGIEAVPAVPEAPPDAGQYRVDRVIRGVLLLIFAAAALSVLLVGYAPQRDQAAFLEECQAGRVTSVAYDEQGRLHWAEGDWAWYRTQLDLSSRAFLEADRDGDGQPGVQQQDTDGDGVGDSSSSFGPRAEEVRYALQYWHPDAAADAVELRELEVRELELREVGPDGGSWRDWIAPHWLAVATGFAWLLAFLMAGLRRRRFANGWAWLLMLFLSPFGAPLYLLLEPGPLWRRAGWQPGRRRLDARHALLALLVSFLVTSMIGIS